MIAYHHAERPTTLSGAELDRRLAAGWFRMHQEIFTTTHLFSGDQAYRVHWLRFALPAIRERSSHRRLRRRNASFTVVVNDLSDIPTEHEDLYTVYRASIDFEGADSVAHALFGEDAAKENIFDTKCISVFDGGRLIAAGYLDVGEQSGASILHFFDPEYKRFSLGKFLILLSLDNLRELGKTLYYPGYVVAGKEKMNYKLFLGREVATYFDPVSGNWRAFDDHILLPESLSELDRFRVTVALLS